jgi:hypothetical protein
MKYSLLKTSALIAVAISCLLASCTITRQKCNELYPPVTVHSADTFLQVRETILHDTTFLPADVSEMDIYFEADSAQNVQVIRSDSKNGKRSGVNYTMQRNNKILKATIDCNCDSLAIYHTFKSLDTSVNVHTTNTEIQTLTVPAALTWWQATKIHWGGYALGFNLLLLLLLLAWLAWQLFKVATPQGAAISAAGIGLNWFTKLFKR